MTTNLFQQNSSINLADDYLNTLLTGNVMKYSADLAIFFKCDNVLAIRGHNGSIDPSF